VRVDGVTSGAVVNIVAGNTTVGTATAQGSSITIDVNLASVGDGLHALRATQRLNNVTSDNSPTLNVQLDRQAPSITSSPPTTGHILQPYSYDVQSPDEATNSVAYALINGPTGATIDATTGNLTWTPTVTQRGQHNFTVRARDVAGR
jgi:large repetitive protein